MKKKSLIIGVILIVVIGTFAYFSRNSDNIETSITIKNDTSEIFESVGIVSDSKVILNKTNAEKYYFPKSLTSELNEVCVIAISKDGKVLRSNEISSKDNKNLIIKDIEKDSLKLNVEGQPKSPNEIKIPSLIDWEIKIDGNKIVGTFKADSDIKYKIYVLGKGGELGVSDVENNNNQVVASWEKPKKGLDSWLELTK